VLKKEAAQPVRPDGGPHIAVMLLKEDMTMNALIRLRSFYTTFELACAC